MAIASSPLSHPTHLVLVHLHIVFHFNISIIASLRGKEKLFPQFRDHFHGPTHLLPANRDPHNKKQGPLIRYRCLTLVIVAIIKHGLGGGKKHYSICVPDMAKNIQVGEELPRLLRAGRGLVSLLQL